MPSSVAVSTGSCKETYQQTWYRNEVIVECYLAAVRNDDIRCRAVARALGRILNGSHNIHAFDDFSEYDVLAVEPASHNRGDELGRREYVAIYTFSSTHKLGAVGVLASVRHGEKTRLGMPELAGKRISIRCGTIEGSVTHKFSSAKRSP